MKKVVLLIIPVVTIQLFLVACQSKNQPHEQENTEFYYYPQKNVYYNVEKNNFLYSVDGGKTWDSITNSLEKEPATLGEKIIIYSANNDVYKDNAAHRKQYNGKIYNIVDEDTVLTSAAPEVTERKIQKKTTAKVLQEEEPKIEETQKKGLKKFLEKIFGKHKKTKIIDSL